MRRGRVRRPRQSALSPGVGRGGQCEWLGHQPGEPVEQTPLDLQSIADLRNLIDLLEARGYAQQDIEKIMHGNWLALLERAWA